MTPRVGVLSLQGDVSEHIAAFERIGVPAEPVKTRERIEALDVLVLPGGESTTLSKLLTRFDLVEPIKKRYSEGMCIFATCAGLILLAREVENNDVNVLGLLDVRVRRNAFGRQVESFETPISLTFDTQPFPAVFIRAPRIVSAGSAEVVGTLDGEPVLVRQDRILAATFHPEVTEDLRIHTYFLETICRR